MNMYSKHPQAQAMQKFIHDSNQQLSFLRQRKRRLTEWLEENGDKAKEAGIDIQSLRVLSIGLDTQEIGIKKVIDAYYKEFEADFPESN